MKSKIDTSGWKEFKLGELFEFSAIKQAKSQQLIPTVSKEDDNSIPYVVQSKYNNMVRNVPDDPAQRKWYQSLLKVIDNAITRLTGFLNKELRVE